MTNINNSEKLFITGGNGFIGSHLLPHLISKGYSIKCLLRETSNTKRIEGLEYEYIIGDIRDISCLTEGIKDCHGIIHLAAIANWNDIGSSQVYNVIVEGTNNVLRAAKNNGNIRTVFVSSASAVGGTRDAYIQNENEQFGLKDNKYSYASAKFKAEKLCQKYVIKGLPVIIVNPTEVFGPGDIDLVTAKTLVEFAKCKQIFITKGGTSIVHVQDVAQGILAAYKKGDIGERYILGGDNLNFYELSALTLKILNMKKSIITVPHLLVKLFIILSRFFKLKSGINPAAMEYALLYWFMDNIKAKRKLNIKFRSAKDTLIPTLEWLREEGFISMDNTPNHNENKG